MDWNDLLYRTLAFAHLEWREYHMAMVRNYGVFVRTHYNEGVYCRDEQDLEILSREFLHVLFKPCECQKARITMPAWEAFLENGTDSQQFIKWCEDQKGVKFDWGIEKKEGEDERNPDIRWFFDVDGTRRFLIRRVQPFAYVDAAAFTIIEHDQRFKDLASTYRASCHARAGLEAKRAKWAEQKEAAAQS